MMGIRRFGLLAACLAMLGVTGAVGIASNAAAALPAPVWAECVKASPKNTGDYTSKTCTATSEPGTGPYALREGLGNDKEFKGKAGSVALLMRSWESRPPCRDADCSVLCTSSKVAGKDGLPNLETNVQIVLSKCAYGGHSEIPCTTPGAKEGEIKFKPLRGELGYVEESPTVVGLRLESQASPGGPVVELYCGGSTSPSKHKIHEIVKTATLEGAFIGTLEGNTDQVSKAYTLADLAAARYGEHEISWGPNESEKVMYSPLVNNIGWATELPAIEADETPAHVLSGEECGQSIENDFHKECTPRAYMGFNQTVALKGEALMIKT
jgi:hypothetical protein